MPFVKHLHAVNVNSLAAVDQVQAATGVERCVCAMSGGGSIKAFVFPPDRGGRSTVLIRYGCGRVKCVINSGYLAPDAMVG